MSDEETDLGSTLDDRSAGLSRSTLPPIRVEPSNVEPSNVEPPQHDDMRELIYDLRFESASRLFE